MYGGPAIIEKKTESKVWTYRHTHTHGQTLMQPTTVSVRGEVSWVTKMVAYIRMKLKWR